MGRQRLFFFFFLKTGRHRSASMYVSAIKRDVVDKGGVWTDRVRLVVADGENKGLQDELISFRFKQPLQQESRTSRSNTGQQQGSIW